MDEGGKPRWWSLLAGALALVGFVAALSMVPRGPSEFAYDPFDLTWPWGLGRGFEVMELISYGIGLVGGGVSVGLLSWGLAPVVPDRVRGRPGRWAVAVMSVAAVMATAALLMIGGRALVPDELSYAEQARGYVEGLLLVPAPDGLFVEAFDILSPTGGGLASKYLFGEAVVQIPGVMLGLPGLLHVPLLVLGAWAIWRAATLHGGPGIGTVALGLVALSPMLSWVSGTGLSHTPAFAAIAVAALGEAMVLRGRSWTGAVLVGLGVACAGMVRPQVAVPVGGVLCLFTWWHLRRTTPAALMALVGIPLVAGGVIAGYDWLVTGHPMRLPWALTGERFGFGTPVPGMAHVHGLTEGLQNVVTNGVRLSTWWIGWPTGLVFVGLFLWRGRPLGSLRSWVLASAAQLLFMVGYFAPGIYDVGPIYGLEVILGLSAVGACGLVGLYDERPRWALSLGLVWVLVGVPSTWLWAGLRVDRLLDQVHAPVEAALAQVPATNAILLVETDCTESLSEASMLTSIAERRRTPGAPLVVVPRPEPDQLEAFVAFYGPRDCYYAHRRPQTGQVEVLSCDAAADLLARPRFLSTDWSRCPRFRSYAERFGLRSDVRPGAPQKR